MAEIDGEYRFAVAISENMTLEVIVQQTEMGWNVLGWQTVSKEQTADDGLNVWNGK